MAALAKRTPPADEAVSSPAEIAVAVALGVVTDIELSLADARRTAEEIADAIRPLAYAGARGDAAAQQRLVELRSDASRNRQEIDDLTVALSEAKQRLADAEATQRAADDAAILDHARDLADQFVEQSQIIDDALAVIVAAHRERRTLALGILRSGCLHPAWHHALDDPSRMHHALSVSGAAAVLTPGEPPASGKVFAISSLAAADAATLRGLALENRTARANF